MKKHLLLLAIVFTGLSLNAQISVPNGNFEHWNSATCDVPTNYPGHSNQQNFFRLHLPFNVTKTTDAYHGTYAVQLENNANATDTAYAYIFSLKPESSPANWKGMVPINEKPTGIRGYYKYNVDITDSVTLFVIFSKAGANIGTYLYPIGGIHNTYTLFDFTFDPALAAIPDSISFGVLTAKFSGTDSEPHGIAGSILKIDSVSLTGINTQPEINGDFESWKSETYYSPIGWYTDDNSEGFSRTSDAVSGNYAIELQTYLGNRDGKDMARSSSLSTGYYDNNCNNNCNQKGGIPFTNQKDTLTFFYKYTPSGNDSAMVNLSLKKDGINFYYTEIALKASPAYKYCEIPFNAGQTPDSVILNFQSSYWSDTLVSFVGSTLIIDSIKFKALTQPTGLIYAGKWNTLVVSPNPSNTGYFKIKTISSETRLIEIFDSKGAKILSKNISSGSNTHEIDLSKAPKGIYFVKVYGKWGICTQKLLKL